MSITQRVLTVLLGASFCLGLILLSSLSTGLIDIYNEKRIFEGILLVLGSIFFLILVGKHQLNINRREIYTWGLFFVLILISIISASYLEKAFWEIAWYLCLMQLAFVTAYLCQKNPIRFERYLLVTLTVFITVYIIRVAGDLITGYFDPNWPQWPDHTRSVVIFDGENIAKNGFLGFKNVRFLNHLQTWTLPILIFGYIKYSKILSNGFKYFFITLFSCWWMLAFASGARGTLIASLVSLIALFLLFKKRAKSIGRYYLITSSLGLILYLVIFHLLLPESSSKELARTHSGRRFELWWATWQLIKENFWFGVGPMHMANVNGENPMTSPHNIYLMWAAEWGIPAFTIGLFIGLRNIIQWIKNALNNISIKHIAITASLIAGIIHSGVSGLLITPLSQLLFVIILGWAIGTYYSDSNSQVFKQKKDFTIYRLSALLVLFLLNVWVFVQVFGSIPKLQENKDKFQHLRSQDKIELFPTSRATIYPRFWDQGFIGIEEVSNSNQKD